jgi:hypothetical protein
LIAFIFLAASQLIRPDGFAGIAFGASRISGMGEIYPITPPSATIFAGGVCNPSLAKPRQILLAAGLSLALAAPGGGIVPIMAPLAQCSQV